MGTCWYQWSAFIVDIQVQTIKQVVVILAKEGGRSGFVVLGRVSGSYRQW